MQSVTWEGSARQAPRTLTFSIAFSPHDSNIGTVKVNLGDKVTLYNAVSRRVFAGFVTSKEKKSEAGVLTYTAKDNMMHLLQSKGTYKFTNKTPEQIVKKICADAKVPVGDLIKTKVNIDKAFFSERPLYEIIMAVYTKAYRKTGKLYIAMMDDRKLTVIEKGRVIPRFQLKQGERIVASTLTETIDNMVNRVAVYNGDNQRVGTISNDTWVKNYGVFQETLTVDSGSGKAEAKSMLSGIEKTANVSCLGDTKCVAGRGVSILDAKTGLNGVFWIESDSHTWADNVQTMELELVFKNFMDIQEFDEEPKKEESSSSVNVVGAGGGVLNGRRVKARFTAYWPGPGIEGGPLDAFNTPLSHFLNNGINVVATPPSIPKDTQIQILETGTNRDGGVYATRDRGGAIQVLSDGTYRFDILMSNNAECNAWGIRDGYAIIGDGSGYTQSSSGGGASNSVTERATAQMEAWANNPAHGYSQQNRWGPDYDCSSAIITAWQMVGVPVKSGGATYTGNMQSVFTSCGFRDVSSSCNLGNGSGMLRGDVLLNHVHHTAMYSGDGRMVHARGQSYGSSASGDQGQEFAITPYSNYPWNSVLRYSG